MPGIHPGGAILPALSVAWGHGKSGLFAHSEAR